MKRLFGKAFTIVTAVITAAALIFTTGCSYDIGSLLNGVDPTDRIDVVLSEISLEETISKMSLDEKISQMIIPAARTWNEENFTDLNKVPEIKEALRRHQYGGIILYGQNITGTGQVTRLLHDLQENNKAIENVSVHIPYLTTVDEEGGRVIRLTSGTRMNGNMAIGATDNAADDAFKTGEIIGEELAAIGFNTDFAPVVDVNNNPANPVIGTRSFSDDTELVAELGKAYAAGLAESNVIATFKHFPGHGDTGADSHIGTPSVEKTCEEIGETELKPFQAMIDNGADMIMTAHITYPNIDEEVVYGDGKTKGYYPATMSKKMITDILRHDMGFDGVVVADALEMDAIRTAGLVPGAEDSTEYRVNIAEKVINAGVDMILLPMDMIDKDAVAFYDDYIAGIEEKVNSGEISEDRIDESVKRILSLKTKYGIFDADRSLKDETDIEDKVQNALKVVGSEAHHKAETEIARQAITLLKDDCGLIPVSKDIKNIVLLGEHKTDEPTLSYAVNELKRAGLIDRDAKISVEYYHDPKADEQLHYTDEMKEKIASADLVLGFSAASGGNVLDNEDPRYIGISNAIEDTHSGGGKFILISVNLPYDAAAFQDADAILLAYMGAGLDLDPTEKTDAGTAAGAVNANVIAAVETVFGLNDPQGKVPVNIPKIKTNDDGTREYSSDILYPRGYGLSGDNMRQTLSREGYELEQAVVLSRHNIRAPLSGAGSALDTITPHKWFDWSSKASELSVRGGTLETEMGQYFRKWLESEGLFEENFRPEDGKIRIYANSKQRTIATARFFSAGLLPVYNSNVEYHCEFDTMDPVFNPVFTYVSDEYAKDADAEMHELFDPLIEGLSDNYELLSDVIDADESEDAVNGSYTGFKTGDQVFAIEEGKEPAVSGSLKKGCQISDALVLQHYEEPDSKKAAFGHDITEEDWEAISEVKDLYGDALFTAPSVAVNVAHPLLQEIQKELNTKERLFTFLCGHDSNLGSVLAALGVEDYALPGTIEKKTPIGAKLVIGRWKNEAGEELISLDLVYQKTEQLQDLELIGLNNPPGIYSLRLKGLKADGNGLYRAEDVLKRLADAIAGYDDLIDKYELEEAA